MDNDVVLLSDLADYNLELNDLNDVSVLDQLAGLGYVGLGKRAAQLRAAGKVGTGRKLEVFDGVQLVLQDQIELLAAVGNVRFFPQSPDTTLSSNYESNPLPFTRTVIKSICFRLARVSLTAAEIAAFDDGLVTVKIQNIEVAKVPLEKMLGLRLQESATANEYDVMEHRGIYQFKRPLILDGTTKNIVVEVYFNAAPKAIKVKCQLEAMAFNKRS